MKGVLQSAERKVVKKQQDQRLATANTKLHRSTLCAWQLSTSARGAVQAGGRPALCTVSHICD